MDLIQKLARHSDEPDKLTRLYLSRSHESAARFVRSLMAAAGLTAHIDAAGNVVGRLSGREPDAPALLIGSHIDTVLDAGKYDGNLGVVLGIVAMEAFQADGFVPRRNIEILAFGDEENVRFPTTLSTAHALAGNYDAAWLDTRDAEGVRLRDALVAFGGDPDRIAHIAYAPGSVSAYCEVHIEQGPLLETENLPLGIVTAIFGATRARVRVKGEAGHVGTVPMALRRDALAACAEMISAVERIGSAQQGTVATVGVAQVEPGAVNVIPGQVDFTLDVRSADDATRHIMVREIVAACEAIAKKRQVAFQFVPFMDSPATQMSPDLIKVFERALASRGIQPYRLSSGAGHDAVAMAQLCPVGMLFVRCRGGISHNPAESITVEDADLAAKVLMEAIKQLA